MTIRERLQIIGRAITNRSDPIVQSINIPKKEKQLLGSFIDFSPNKLSDEKTISEKLMHSFNEWVFMNVSTLSEEVSKLEPELHKVVLKGGEMQMDKIEEHPLLDLLDRWNDHTTSSDAFYLTEAHLDLAGDAFWYVEGKGEPESLYVLQPEKMKLKLGEYDKETGTSIEGYEYKIVVDGKPKEIMYEPEEIIHIKVPNPSNPYRGKSTVEAIAQTLDIDMYSNDSSRAFYERGMIAQFLLTTDQRLNQDQIKRLQAEMRAAYMGAKNSWKIPIVGGGLQVQNTQMTSREAEFLNQQKWLRDKIMVGFKNTPMSLGIVEDVNRAQGESSLLSWKRSVIKPKMQRIVDSLNEFLLPRYGPNLILGFKDPVPEDRAAKISEATQLVGADIISVNEARDLLEFDPVPSGDEFRRERGERMAEQIQQGIPEPVKNVNYQRVLRKSGIYTELLKRRELKTAIRPKIKAILDKKAPSQHRVVNFWKRVAAIIDQVENIFGQRLESFINTVVEEGQLRLGNEEARQSGELINMELRKSQAEAIFAPILMEAVVAAGTQANRLLNIENPYIPKQLKQVDVRSRINEQIALFAASMLETDRQTMADIIAAGLEEGASIPQIRKAIEEKFADFTRVQAERITRSEVAWAANRGIVDSYKQSGVVVAKQWLSAPDACPYCEPLNGQLIGLEESYFDKGTEYLGNAPSPMRLDYRDIEEPPLHPNCRCTVISVIEGVAPLIEPKSFSDIQLKQKILYLESQIDKRTKAYRDLQRNQLEDKEYIMQLEQILGV